MHGLEHLGSNAEISGTRSSGVNNKPLNPLSPNQHWWQRQGWSNTSDQTTDGIKASPEGTEKPRDMKQSAMPQRQLGRFSGYGAGLSTGHTKETDTAVADTTDIITDAVLDERLRRTGF